MLCDTTGIMGIGLSCGACMLDVWNGRVRIAASFSDIESLFSVDDTDMTHGS